MTAIVFKHALIRCFFPLLLTFLKATGHERALVSLHKTGILVSLIYILSYPQDHRARLSNWNVLLIYLVDTQRNWTHTFPIYKNADAFIM